MPENSVSISLKLRDGANDIMISVVDSDDANAIARLRKLRDDALDKFFSETLRKKAREDLDSLGRYPGMELKDDLHTVVIEPRPDDPDKIKVSFMPRLRNGQKGKWAAFVDFQSVDHWVEFFKGFHLVYVAEDGTKKKFIPTAKTFEVPRAFEVASETSVVYAVVSDRRKSEQDDGTPGNYYDDPVRVEE